MTIGNNIPSPFKHLAGNCIVTSIGLGSDCSGDVDRSIRPDGRGSLSSDYHDIASTNACTNPASQVRKTTENPPTTSPFVEASADSLRNARGISAHKNMSPPPTINSGPGLGGLIYIDKTPTVTVPGQEISQDRGVKLIPGKDIKNKIKGAAGQ